jgi:hypothetical protein
MGVRTLAAITAGVFGAGAVVGLMAARRGVPPDQIRPWLTRGILRGLIRAHDRILGARSR